MKKRKPVEELYIPTGVQTWDDDTRTHPSGPSIIQKRPAEVGTILVGAVMVLISQVVELSNEVQGALTTIVLLTPAVISNLVDRLRNSS